MENLKSIVVSLMVLAILILAGCNSRSNNSKTTESSIEVDAILSLTGNAATLGEYARKGILLAVEEKNSQGGVLGKQISLNIHDSKSQPKEGVSIAQQIVSANNKPVLVYSQLSSISLAVKPITEEHDQLMFALSGADNLLDGTKHTFRNWLPPIETGRRLVQFIKDSLGVQDLGILYSNGDFSRSMKDAAIKEGEKLGLQISFEEAYDESGTDFKATALKAKQAAPPFLYVIGIGRSLGTIIKQLREVGYEGVIVGDATMNLPDVRTIAGDALKGAYFIDFGFNNQSSSRNTQQFVKDFKTKFDKDPQTLSAISYDAMNILFKAIEKTNSTNSDTLVQALNGMQNFNSTFGKVDIEKFDIIYPMSLKQF